MTRCTRRTSSTSYALGNTLLLSTERSLGPYRLRRSIVASTLYLMANAHDRLVKSLPLTMHYPRALTMCIVLSAGTYKGISSRFFADRVPRWLLRYASLECPQGENSAYTLEVPYQVARPRFHGSIECTLYRGSAFNIDSCLLGGFHTQFASSPLFVEATLS
jgi:hypothetical protein